MLAKTPEAVSQELLDKIPYPITLEEFITNILVVYPVKLNAFTILRADNEVDVLNFPFNPAITPIELMIGQAISEATEKDLIIGKKKNGLGGILIENLQMNKEAIEGELGISFEDFMKKECKFIRKKDTGTSLLLADAQGSVDGDTLEIGIEL